MTGFIIKLAVTIGIVLALSRVAERYSPKTAGILAGFPLGTALILFFFGLDNSPQFAAESAAYMTAGVVAEIVFLYVYYRASFLFTERLKSIVSSSALACLAYGLVSWALHEFNFDVYAGTVIYVLTLVICIYLFRKIPDVTIEKQVKMTFSTVCFRAVLTVVLLIAVTESAELVGPSWAGLLASFPSILFPLILIMHWTYGKGSANTVIKYIPNGLGGLLVYIFAVILLYPPLGLYWGTAASLLASLVYMFLYAGIMEGLSRLKHK